jgi:hypothetical protein
MNHCRCRGLVLFGACEICGVFWRGCEISSAAEIFIRPPSIRSPMAKAKPIEVKVQ